MTLALRSLGVFVLLVGAATLASLTLAEEFQALSPGLLEWDWSQAADLRRWAWIAAGLLYLLTGLLLVLLRSGALAGAVASAVLAAACMVYDVYAFAAADDGLAVARIRMDVISLVFALLLVGLTAPMARRARLT